MILRLSKLRRIWLCLFDRLFWPLGTVYSWLARASLGKINTLRPATGYPRSPHVIWLKLVAMADFTCYKFFHFNTKNMYICITYHQNLFSITCLQNLWNLGIPRTTDISIINMQVPFHIFQHPVLSSTDFSSDPVYSPPPSFFPASLFPHMQVSGHSPRCCHEQLPWYSNQEGFCPEKCKYFLHIFFCKWRINIICHSFYTVPHIYERGTRQFLKDKFLERNFLTGS